MRNFDSDTVGYCDKCGFEVYDGDSIYIIDGFVICDECFPDYAREYFSCSKHFGEHLRRRRNVT